MTKHQTHHDIKLNLPIHKLKKLAKGQRIQVDANEIADGDHHVKIHHETHKKIQQARKRGKGLRLGPFTHEEIMNSGSLWDSVKGGLKWLGSAALDGISGAASASIPQLAPVFQGIRGGVKELTGVGLKKKKAKKAKPSKKGTQEMKDKMAKVRAAKGKKISGGSFLLNAN